MIRLRDPPGCTPLTVEVVMTVLPTGKIEHAVHLITISRCLQVVSQPVVIGVDAVIESRLASRNIYSTRCPSHLFAS